MAEVNKIIIKYKDDQIIKTSSKISILYNMVGTGNDLKLLNSFYNGLNSKYNLNLELYV